MLNKQYNLYSVDTSNFYTRKERKLHKKKCILSKEYSELSAIIKDLKNNIKDTDAEKRLLFYQSIKKLKGQKIKEVKEELISCFKERLQRTNQQPRKLTHVSTFGSEIISIFDSNVTRLFHMNEKDINNDLIIIRSYYFDILKDIILNGFVFQGFKYVFFTASAGQIRTKKAVFIREDLWKQNEKTLMCGLTVDRINDMGGMNVNKFLAYLALNNSATDMWTDFDIDKTIVVSDYEPLVRGTVDYIDYKTFNIERQETQIPINHTDGAGMILPSVSQKNFMVRLPWIKGLLCSFNFVRFIEQFNGNPVIKDIYGQAHNILEEDIQIIFFKSQFKAHQYYKDWDEYKSYFKKYHCQAGICNVEEDEVPKAQINYQMLQTLPDITNQELLRLADKSNLKLTRLTSTVDAMKQVFGVSRTNRNKTYLQQALEIYPELFQDSYCKEVLKQIKKALVKRYRSGKLEIDGKYTFIIPDWFAVCENIFLGIEQPQGLLKDGQVCCHLYRNKKKLDCLRSPHLYREHAVRENVINDNTSHWYTTDGLYISTFDLISKLLQLDVDGDKSLVVADELIIKIAERNMQGTVPLYYEMKKANPEMLSKNNIYKGMILAYTGGNIGIYSNAITKIWNNEVWQVGTDEEKREALNTIKYLCLIGNFAIDYAKTLFKPDIPQNVKELIHRYTKCKVPYFFKFAKEKTESQIEPINNSVVNRLSKTIVNRKLHFGSTELNKLDYKKMMSNPDIDIDMSVVNKYLILNKLYRFQLRIEEDFDRTNNVGYLAEMIVSTLKMNQYTKVQVSDMLLKYLYTVKDTPFKECVWFCFGDQIVKNLKSHLKHENCICGKCGRRFKPKMANQKYCDKCGGGYQKIATKLRVCLICGETYLVSSKDNYTQMCTKCKTRLLNDDKHIYCKRCGKEVIIKRKNNRTQFCSECYKKHRKKYKQNRDKTNTSQFNS